MPKRLNEMLEGADRDGARRAMQQMLQMGKLDIEPLERAYRGE